MQPPIERVSGQRWMLGHRSIVVSVPSEMFNRIEIGKLTEPVQEIHTATFEPLSQMEGFVLDFSKNKMTSASKSEEYQHQSKKARTNGSKEFPVSTSNEENESKNNSETNNEQPVQTSMVSVTNLALENIGLDPKLEGPTWSTKWEAIAATLTYLTCSGNFWFFPFLCAYYGGFFPYQFTVCYLLIGIPLLYMEMALGQYSSASPLSVFSRMAPAMAGLSAGMCFILVLRTVALSVWAIYELTITLNAAQSAWITPPWSGCPDNKTDCFDYRLDKQCTWMPAGISPKCDQYQNLLVEARGFVRRKSPFISFIDTSVFRKSLIASDWTPPLLTSVISAVILWLFVGIVSIGGSKVLGKTGAAAVALLFLGSLTVLVRGAFFKDSLVAAVSFLIPSEVPQDKWMLIWSWVDAAVHTLRALNVGCGGVQKFASLNKFNNRITRDIVIIGGSVYLFNICAGLFSVMYIAEYSSLYYPDVDFRERISFYTSPIFTEVIISEIITSMHWGSFLICIFWLTMALCSAQGVAGDIWVISSMILERINGSRRKYGQPLASWHKRALILGVMCIFGLVSSFPFLGTGGMDLMSIVDFCSSYGTVFIALVQMITVSYVYGFKRFSVNICAMVGGRGPPNIFWWLNWLIISPLLLLIVFICVVTSSAYKQSVHYEMTLLEIIEWSLIIMPIIFVVFHFVREDIDRRRNMEPFAVLLRATGDWGPMNGEDKRQALKFERQLRVRY
uniref:Transporter n=1 Tax=Caenorhabditis japonica TaxID=281687 RepID=A0A8R1HY25_CAEJA